MGIDLDLKVVGVPRQLKPGIDVAVFRVLQEALNNIRKHAKARRVVMVLDFSGPHVRGMVEDDGVGFDMEELKVLTRQDRGLGVAGMVERVNLLGGKLTIDSKVSKGTKVDFFIPLS